MFNLSKTFRSLKNPLQIAESTARWSHYARLVHGPWSERFGFSKGISICAEPCGMWRVHKTLLLHVSQIVQTRKSNANKQDFEIKLNLSYRARSTSKITGSFSKVFCTFGPNLVILAWTGDELSHGKAQNEVNFDFEVTFDFEGQGQSPKKQQGS